MRKITRMNVTQVTKFGIKQLLKKITVKNNTPARVLKIQNPRTKKTY